MKRIYLAILTLLVFGSVSAEDSIQTATQIDSVMVYRHGALVQRHASLNLPKGTTVVYLDSLTSELDASTVRVRLDREDVTIASVKTEQYFVYDEKIKRRIADNRSRLGVMRDSLQLLDLEFQELASAEDLLLRNRSMRGNGERPVSVAALREMVEYQDREDAAIRQRRNQLEQRTEVLLQETNRLQQETKNLDQQVAKKRSRVRLDLSTAQAQKNVRVLLSYLVDDASWTPVYEVRVKDVSKPLELVYGAQLRQHTDETWPSVKLTLSTGDPSIDNTRPEFYQICVPPCLWKRVEAQIQEQSSDEAAPGSGILARGTVTLSDEDNEPAVGAYILVSGTETGVMTDVDGNFELTVPSGKSVSVSYSGYKTQILVPRNNMRVSLEPDESMLEEIEVVNVGYGTVKRRNSHRKSSYDEEFVDEDVVSTGRETKVALQAKETMTATEFVIEKPYTVPDDGKDHRIDMLDYRMAVQYEYVAQPRHNKEVWLSACIPDYAGYNLLEGPATVYLDHVYQGSIRLAPDSKEDTLSLSIGRDKDIAISRELLKEFTSHKIVGSTAKVKRAFEIVVKNNKEIPVMLELVDQYPVAKYSDFKVTLLEAEGAEADSETGKLTWNLPLQAGERRVIRFSYEVKYPKWRGDDVVE